MEETSAIFNMRDHEHLSCRGHAVWKNQSGQPVPCKIALTSERLVLLENVSNVIGDVVNKNLGKLAVFCLVLICILLCISNCNVRYTAFAFLVALLLFCIYIWNSIRRSRHALSGCRILFGGERNALEGIHIAMEDSKAANGHVRIVCVDGSSTEAEVDTEMCKALNRSHLKKL